MLKQIARALFWLNRASTGVNIRAIRICAFLTRPGARLDPLIIRSRTDLGVQMIASAKTAVRVFGAASDSEILRQIALLCGAGLLVSLLMLTYGIDLSPGLF